VALQVPPPLADPFATRRVRGWPDSNNHRMRLKDLTPSTAATILVGMEQRVRYGARGRRARRWTAGRIVVVILIVLAVLLVVSYVVFNTGGTVPGSGEGQQIPQ
jgi:hypothetical protein